MGKIRNHHKEAKPWPLSSIINEVKAMIKMKEEIIADGVEKYHVYISPVNSKGAPSSVSLIPGHDCPNCKFCICDCYDIRHDTIMATVKKTRAINSAIFEKDPDRFFAEISRKCYCIDRFRWFVGGDVKSMSMFAGIVNVAINNPHCKFHLFTKNHRAVNEFLSLGETIPENLHIRLSEWDGMNTENPYDLNLCSVFSIKDDFTPGENEVVCSENCTECAIRNANCFNSKIKRILLKKH